MTSLAKKKVKSKYEFFSEGIEIFQEHLFIESDFELSQMLVCSIKFRRQRKKKKKNNNIIEKVGKLVKS